MAAFANSDLKRWREAQRRTAADVAEHVNCDVTTIYRYESGKLKPDPDVMYQICEYLGDIGLWQDWMRTEYPTSYARIHPQQEGHSLGGSLMSLYAAARDLVELSDELFRDMADGKMDSPANRQALLEVARELLASSQNISNIAINRSL